MRLMIGTTTGVSVVLAAAGVALYLLVRAHLYNQLDASLIQQTHAVTAIFESNPHGVDLDLHKLSSPAYSDPAGDEFYQVWSDDGRVLKRSPSLRDRDLIAPPKPVDAPTVRSVTLPGGRPCRLALLTVIPPVEREHVLVGIDPDQVSATRVTLAIAATPSHIEASLSQLRNLLILAWLVTLAVLVGVLTLAVRAGLAPADLLAERLRTMDENSLAERVDVPQTPRELEPVVHRLNDLLARLEAAFLRERTLLADVAHELRTPLAGLRSTLEVSLARPRDAASYRDDLASCLGISAKLQSIVENLLTMARLEAGQTALRIETTRPHELLESCWSALRELTEQRSLSIRWDVDTSLSIETDATKARILIWNLLQNAACYADADSEVRVETLRLDDAAVVRITNAGCDIAAADAERVFDRFWRADTSRGDEGGHCGLGLPLCRNIVELLGGSIRVDCERGGTFAVEVRLPVRRDGSAPRDAAPTKLSKNESHQPTTMTESRA
ncbi:MAG: hypothetical protein GC159_18555 [Phycisphaera sp.]|nr:hypothetical protein [Phycisphaera sp.]